MKKTSLVYVLIAFITGMVFIGCDTGNKWEPPEAYPISFSPAEGTPGTIVTLTCSTTLSEDNVIYFGNKQSAILQLSGGDSYQTIVPFCSPEVISVEIREETNNDLVATGSFTVLESPGGSGTPGDITTQFNNDLRDLFITIRDNIGSVLYTEGILNDHNKALYESEITRYTTALDNISSIIAALPDSEKVYLDQAIYSSGLQDMVTDARTRISERNTTLGEYSKQHALVALDVTSSSLTLVSRGLLLVTVISAVTTGPGAAIPGGATIIVKAMDNLIDGFIPTDLDYLYIDNESHTVCLTDVTVQIDENEEIFIMGTFVPQSNPIRASLNLVTGEIVSELGLDALLSAILEALTNAGLNTAEEITGITEDWQEIDNTECRIDPNLYGGGITSLRTILTAASLPCPGVGVIIFLSLPTHDYKTLNSSIAGFNKNASEIEGLSIGSTSLEYGGYRFKKMDGWGGVIFNAIVGVEYPQSLENSQIEPFSVNVEGYPDPVNDILTPEQMDILEDLGLVIHPGFTPPNVEGDYFVSPFYCTASNITGDVFLYDYCSDYRYDFYNQTPSLTLNASYYATETVDSAVGVGSFVSGTDSSFTVFLELIGETSSATYTMVQVISGSINALGITDFQMGLILTSKDDPYDTLMPVNGARIWIDEDGLATRITSKLSRITANNGRSSFLSIK